LVLLLLVPACGGDDATGPGDNTPQVPNLVGSYDGNFTYTISAPGYQTESESCPARITVANQSGGSFSGTFSQTSTANCMAESGTIQGNVEVGGALTMSAAYTSSGPTWEERTGCTVLSSDTHYSGSYVGGIFSCSYTMTASCPQASNVTITMNVGFRGT
jgi:hypothetical protein